MDAFKKYLQLDYPDDVIDHTRTLVANYIPGMDVTKEYGIDYYEAAEKAIKRFPVLEHISGKMFDDLRGLANFIAKDFCETINSTGILSDEEYAQIKEDPDAYLATNFGISGA